MKYFERLLLCLLAGVTMNAYAQTAPLKRVEPAFWWSGMKNSKLQVLLYGDNIASATVTAKYPGLTLKKVSKVENPNYLFVDFETAAAKPGKFDIILSFPGGAKTTYAYELKQRANDGKKAQGVTSKDLIYLLMPDRFANGDVSNDKVNGMRDMSLSRDSLYTRHGGDLQGVINNLDYLKDLGITAIWMTPEVENDQKSASYHGYAATDFYKIDPRYGTNELYKSYVEKCHEKGLKVIKDVVPNHCGSEAWFMHDLPMKSWVHEWPKFTQTTYKDQPAMDPYRNDMDWKLQVDGWFVPTMPDMNESNPFVANYLTQNYIWWIEYTGLDGFRIDTFPYNDLQFMANWMEAVRAEYPKFSIFGEALVNSVVSQAFYTEGATVNQKVDTKLKGVTDVALKNAIYETLNGSFGWTNGVNRLYDVLSQDFIYKNPENNVIFMDNHDMSRYFSMVGQNFDKYKSGLAILFTTRGVPQVYYGTEILMKNFSNPDGWVREDFQGGWPGDKQNKFTAAGRTAFENEAFTFFKTLANYRKTSDALQNGKLMQYVPENGIYVYFRYTNSQTVMVIVNTNDTPQTLNTKRFTDRINSFSTAKDVVSGNQHNKIEEIKLPATSTLVLELGK
ncbi:glycoside hydrolase family 13 protein [Solitalea canadensis]|uniref:Glycosidase n=1 Tax=Solitalea canadensis (strain ATCC 29591 / DSM 3403 / JCM 21819 / LMG 8368 / NBRC 15130 / NCIMB 12057 / USAM 9D) TaxID=929556 RepID=H8KR97_SOLCM|nr:glycoside hydrolase family 13 protein [Solitalea canadensis]AFD07364.1 glycosidase [Solitalea canadensis DSM 3403]